MKKKNLLVIIMFVLSMCIMTSCKQKTNGAPVSEGDITVTVSPTPEPTAEPTTTPAPTKGANDSVTDSILTKEEALELASTYVEEITEEDFSNVVKNFTEEMKKLATEEYLKSTWNSSVKALGEYLGIVSQEASVIDNGFQVNTLLKYENNGLILTLSFTNDSQIQGIFFQYKSLEEEAESDLYKEYDIQIGKGDYLLDGKLTIPAGVTEPPVVILVQGSGQSDYDETIGALSNKPFRDIATGLAEKGIASIRYNKRFYQFADQAYTSATIKEEVLEDVSYAIEYAVADTRVSSDNIFIIGHSLGGMLCPKIATDNEEVAGFISLAGSPRKLEDIIYDQVTNALQEEDTLTEEERNEVIAQYDEAVAKIKNLGSKNLDEAILGVTGYYWRSLNDIDAEKLVSELKIPMLFLQGSADFQVFPDKDFQGWKTILNGHDNASFKLYEGLNHLFMPTNGRKNTTEYDVEGTVDEVVIKDMANWILKHSSIK